MVDQIKKTHWEIDKAHTNLSFTISHFMIAKVKGSFKDFAGSFTYAEDDFSDGSLEIVIKADSIDTNDANRDGHLKTPDFFDVATHPEIRFQSSSIEKVGGKEYTIKGNLSVNGIEKPIVLEATYEGEFEHPVYKSTIAVFNATALIERMAFDIGKNYPAAALGEKVSLVSTLELVKK